MQCSVNLLGALALVFSGPLWAACPTADLLARLALMSKLPQQVVAAQLADDALLGPYARGHFADTVHQPSRVGSSHQRQLDEQWLGLITPDIEKRASRARQAARFDDDGLHLEGQSWGPASLSGLNLQQRLALKDGDNATLEHLLWQQALVTLAPNWLKDAGWPEEKIACSKALVENRLDRVWLMQRLGVSTDPHHPSPALDALAKAVSSDDIAAYYQAHQEDFRQLAAVDARLFEADSAAGINRLQPEITHLTRQQAQGQVLKTLAFVTPELGRSAVIRLPSGRYGQVEVLKRHYQQLAPDSESVAFVARQAIAKEQAKANWQALLVKLRQEAQ